MDRLGLVGSAAADATQTTDGLHMFGDGVGPTGLVMGAQAAARMDALKATLCGGLGPPDLSVEVSRTRWDAARQELKLPLRLSISGGTVRAAILSDTTQNADGTELLTPSGSQFTVGGHGGALSLTLTYRRTGALLCDDAHHPELGGIGVDLLVAAGSGPRTVPLQFTLSGPSLPSLPPGLCA
jgi:hypothetical protein